jgi:hypothetical protein
MLEGGAILNDQGVSITQLLTGTIPEPTIRLEWGEYISEENMKLLRSGQTAVLYDVDGNPFSYVLMDFYGQLREKRVEGCNPNTFQPSTSSSE